MLFDFLIAVLVACLAGMGVGGGGLLVIWLVLVRDLPSPTAQGINLVFFTVSALCSLPIHFRKRTFPVRRLLFLTASAIPGVLIGCHLASMLSEEAARRGFGYFLLLTGAVQLYRQIKTHFALDYRKKS